jgi:tetratricopeptide (TPR) repeat protein
MDNFANDIDIPLKENKALENKIKRFIECGQSAERLNKVEEAIRSYYNALSLLIFNSKDNRVFQLYVNIGNLYQLSGNLEEGLSYFKKAYDAAKIQANKTAQVDTLINIADSYLNKGELEAGINYAENAESILKEIDYVKGKLDISLYWSRVYYIKQEHYKARDICNKALALCGDEFFLHKGKILNMLGELYKDIISAEEHLALLNQAIECFEKANYQRGMLGILNNISTVYADKLQDYEKALEYFLKVKALSEDSIYAEFGMITYMNIGEMYYKLLRYEESLYWIKEALRKPSGPYGNNAVFYIYVFLSQVNLKLYNYKESYDYFLKASEELKKHDCLDSILVYYYKSSAALFTEFGQMNKAKTYIKQALSTVEKDESINKWDVGIKYEKIRLKETKGITEVRDILEGIRYTLSKYKNKDEILNAVYDVVIELMSMGFMDLAYSFSEDYSHLEPQSLRVELKRTYINVNKDEGKEKKLIESLISALETAKHMKNEKIHWKVCCSLGDYYFNNSDLEKYGVYYKDAYDRIEAMQNSVPEEFREGFMKYNYLVEPFNKLTNILNNRINEGI